jgi:hypothetical protein
VDLPSEAERRSRGKEVLAMMRGSDDLEREFEDLRSKYPGGLAELVTDFCLGEIWSVPTLTAASAASSLSQRLLLPAILDR